MPYINLVTLRYFEPVKKLLHKAVIYIEIRCFSGKNRGIPEFDISLPLVSRYAYIVPFKGNSKTGVILRDLTALIFCPESPVKDNFSSGFHDSCGYFMEIPLDIGGYRVEILALAVVEDIGGNFIA